MGGFYYYGIDWYYIVLVVPAIIIAMFAQIKVKTTFSKYSKYGTLGGITAYDAARRILQCGGADNVRIECVAGNLTDHFDPKDNVIRLSQSVYSSSSIAAIGVAAHEAGHALQYASNYGPIKLRTAIIPLTNIGSTLSFPLLLAGLILNFSFLIYAGIIAFSLAVLFQLITLPVEFNASARAVKMLRDNNILDKNELQGAKNVLSAAAMTYVGALLVSLMQLLRLILIFGKRND